MNEIATNHHADVAWAKLVARIREELLRRHVHPTHVVVLVPYAQLMQQAKAAWVRDQAGAQFLPRFETTMNWTRLLGAFEPADDDLRLDAARDVLTAANLLARAGLGAQQTVLAPRLVEAAWSLAKVAAAVLPDQRVAWGNRLGDELDSGMATPLLALELAIARIALAWAASSSYATDRLFAAQPGLLVVIDGFQAEPLVTTLIQQLGERALRLSLHADAIPALSPHPNVALRPTQDAEDEAQAAAACVIAHINQGRSPVALVAVDRVLTRRVRAMLADSGVAVRDETGWKLSTTRAAATLMSLLRASVWNASSDAVLDWLKNAPAFDDFAVTAVEIAMRKAAVREWRGAAHLDLDSTLVNDVNTLRESLQPSRTVSAWLVDLRAALKTTGQWPGLVTDVAGQAVLKALRLDAVLDSSVDDEFAPFTTPLSLSEFTVWVSQTCEAESFMPVHPAQAQVVILPLSQLLGRPLPAVVLPGCDEVRLSPSSDPPGLWTPAQREQLGLPSRDALAVALRQSWDYALQAPHIDLLWRTSEGGERLMPSGFVQALLLSTPVHPNAAGASAGTVAADPRALRTLLPQPSQLPAPQGDALPVTRLSSSAYEDLRRCPYRFFALRQLKLQESDELESELSKRDFGNWLHSLLKHFHVALQAIQASKQVKVPVNIDKLAMINIAATQATEELGLSPSEFLPFAAAWPKVRAGYLQWLEAHEATGATFLEAEVWKEMPLGAITLIGKLDRVDTQADGTPLVLDYKTEARSQTADRLKPSTQDTQIAFYGALISDDTLGAAYINLGEKEPSKTYNQPDIVHLRDQLIEGILADTSRIAEGEGLRAMGEGKSCDFCAARGLCRKDFWS